jgi:hypothetical protein
MTTRSLKLVAALCCATACSQTAGATRATITPPPHYVEHVQRTYASRQSERFRELMSEHFGFAAWARDAASIGDVGSTQDALLLLANYGYLDSVPGAWLPRVHALQDDARNAARSTSIAALAHGVARLGGACGDCHAATAGGPQVSGIAPERPPLATDSFPDRMFRHHRAITALWLGLVGPSDSVWNEGASNLVSASAGLRIDEPPPTGFQEALGRLQQLGARARLARTQHERVAAYGQLLAACADCHQRE